jgi:hypothetical protein
VWHGVAWRWRGGVVWRWRGLTVAWLGLAVAWWWQSIAEPCDVDGGDDDNGDASWGNMLMPSKLTRVPRVFQNLQEYVGVFRPLVSAVNGDPYY